MPHTAPPRLCPATCAVTVILWTDLSAHGPPSAGKGRGPGKKRTGGGRRYGRGGD